MRIVLQLSVLVMFAGCVSSSSVTLLPGAENVRITFEPSDVAPCKLLGKVVTKNAASTQAGIAKYLKNEAFALGGDTIFIAHKPALANYTEGVAYTCRR